MVNYRGPRPWELVVPDGEAIEHYEAISIGFGGWVRYQTSRTPGVAVYRRYVDREGRLVADEMYIEAIDGQTAIGADLLRRLELGRIDSAVGLDEFRAQILYSINIPAPDLRTAIRYFTTSFGTRRDRATGKQVPAREHWVADMLLSQIPRNEIPRPPLPPIEQYEPYVLEPIDARLDVPTARPYGDEFYMAVAELYQELAARTRAVAGAIADANGVEVTQVHRWVKVARSKGFLSPTTRGKVG